MIYEKAFAKINLALEVRDEGPDGYHEVQNLMIPIDLYDELFFQKSEEDKVECEIDIENNLCVKAMKLFKQKFNINECVTITLNKKIPIMAGLAGGSTDAAATLRGLNRLFDTKATYDELYEIACQLGSDVPFFLRVQSALCTGRGEKIQPLDIDFGNIPFLIVKPKFGLSTKEIYQHYHWNGISKTANLQKIYEAVETKDYDLLDEYVFNDLEPVALKMSSELKEIFDKIEGLSYIPHISGSGPSIFILNAKSIDLENVKAIDDTLEFYLCHTI